MQEDRGFGQPLVMPWERPTRMDEEAEIELEKRRERVQEMEEKIRRIEMELEAKRIAEEAAAAAAAEKEKQQRMMMASPVQRPKPTVLKAASKVPKIVQTDGRKGPPVVQPVQKPKSQKKSFGEPVYGEPVPSMVKITVPGTISDKRHVVVDRNAEVPIENRIVIQVPGGGGSTLSSTKGSKGGRMPLKPSEDDKTVIVPGVPLDARLKDIERRFYSCGQVVSCSRARRWDGSDSEVVRIKFSHPVEAQQALTMSGFRFMKRMLSVYLCGTKEANRCLAALKWKSNADSKIVRHVPKSKGIQKKSLVQERPVRGRARPGPRRRRSSRK